MSQPEDYVFHETGKKLNPKFKAEDVIKSFICMGKLVTEKNEDLDVSYEDLGEKRFLQYSLYHMNELPNVKSDETEHKDKFVPWENVTKLTHMGYDISRFLRAHRFHKDQLKPYFVEKQYFRCGPAPLELVSITVYPLKED
jgi:hypothetical protein